MPRESTIRVYRSDTASAVPSLTAGEVAVNLTDRRLFVGNAVGGVIPFYAEGVTGINGITGGASITSGTGITITQSGKTITVASAITQYTAPLATSSVTGVASFPNADFSVSSLGAVSLTGNVARTHIGQTFAGLQVFSSGLSSNGITGTILTPSQTNITAVGSLTTLTTAGLTSTQRVTISNGGLSVAGNIDGTIGTAAQPNITSLGSLTTLTTAGLTSTQRVNVSSGGIVVQAGGLSVTGGANITGGSTFFGDIEVYDGAFIRTGGLSVTGGIAGTITTAAQTNITSVGVLNGLSVNNGLSVTGGISVTGGVNIGGGGLSVTGGIAGTITTAAQSNITSLGTLTSLTTSGLLSTQALNVVAGATFGADIYAPIMVTGVNGIPGAVSIASGANVTFPQTGKTITIASSGGGGGGSSPLATSSVTGVASFPDADFSVSSLGAVSLTGNVARTNISQTFSSVQGFAGGFTAAGATFTAQVNMSSNTLYQPTLRYYNEPTSSPTISAGTLTLDLSAAQIFTVSLNAAVTTLTITNTPATASRAIGFTLIFTADGTPRTVTWGAAILWPSGTAPTLTSTNNKRDAFSFITTDGGTTWLGFVGGQNF